MNTWLEAFYRLVAIASVLAAAFCVIGGDYARGTWHLVFTIWMDACANRLEDAARRAA